MPEQFRIWRDRLMAQNPEWAFMLWTERNINQFGFDAQALKKDYLNWAGVSNAVRLKAVLDVGGVYLDMDFEPLRSIEILSTFEAFAARQDTDRLCNAAFGASPKHPWVQWQYDRYHYNRGIPPYWGVELMSTAPRDNMTVVPTEWFYPYLWDAPPEQRVPHPETLLRHDWEGSWGEK